MPEAKTSISFSLKLCISFSVLGLVILPFLLFQPVKFEVDFQNGSFLVGLVYSSVCLLGMTAVFYPKKCQGTFAFRENDVLERSSGQPTGRSEPRFEGHHPTCSKFEGNRIRIRGVVLCAACAGLLLGAIFVLIGTVFYFFFETVFPIADMKILLVGNAAMVLGLAQFVFRGSLKLLVNALFVVGSFVTLVAADLIGGSLFIDLYVLGLIVFLLLTRIMISEWNNKRICLNCARCRFRHDR
jgi:hypothetical protein